MTSQPGAYSSRRDVQSRADTTEHRNARAVEIAPPIDELIAQPALHVRLAPALTALILKREVTAAEATFVLDLVEFVDELATRRARVHRAEEPTCG